MHVQEWLVTVPPFAVYLLVTLVVGVESVGVPLPGEIILVSSALLASQHAGISPVVVGMCATAGAVVGDSLGYAIGRKGGTPLLNGLTRRFPRHFSADNIAAATRAFQRWGVWAVFLGRFVALLRIFAGPLAGVLRMPYVTFFPANLMGGILWAGGTTAAVYYLGVLAEDWLRRFSWIGLALAVVIGLAIILTFSRRRGTRRARCGRGTTP
ncbi:DedA family protein [Streptomyces sp. NPDC012888]|uniref:DedA family protein n=1 Tax=Streptomyces sp. NPDC012888 TaxID=3364855 RepID=UPI003694FD64